MDSGAALLTVHDVGSSEVWVLGLHSICIGKEALHVLREVPALVLHLLMQTDRQLQAIKNIAIDACKRDGEQELLAVSGLSILDYHDGIRSDYVMSKRRQHYTFQKSRWLILNQVGPVPRQVATGLPGKPGFGCSTVGGAV